MMPPSIQLPHVVTPFRFDSCRLLLKDGLDMDWILLLFSTFPKVSILPLNNTPYTQTLLFPAATPLLWLLRSQKGAK